MWCAGVQYQMGFGGAPEIALVQYGKASAGTVNPQMIFYYMIYGNGDAHYGGGGYDRKYYLPTIQVNLLSCATPDIVVPLGSHSPSEMPSVGSRTTPVKFNLQVNNCPAGMASINYGFNFNSGTGYTANQGLFGLTSGSTARGIQVKLLNGDSSQTVELDKWYTLTGYNSSTGGSYTVPLSAAYQRTGAITPGTADAELVIAMSYN